MTSISNIHNPIENRDFDSQKQTKVFYNGAEILFSKDSKFAGFIYEGETIDLIEYDKNNPEKIYYPSPEILKSSVDAYVKAKQTMNLQNASEQQETKGSKHKLSEHTLQKNDKDSVSDTVTKKK